MKFTLIRFTDEFIRKFAPQGIILSGGPESVTMNNTPRIANAVFAMGCPVLGICYGMQAMAVQLGGQVAKGAKREFGYAKVTVKNQSALLGHPSEIDVWMSHGDHVHQLPPEFILIANTADCPIAAMADQKTPLLWIAISS